MLHALVLAAGAGSRFGGGKLTTSFGDGLLIDGAFAAAFASPSETVTVVWGADHAVAEAARAFAGRTSETGRLRLVEAKDHALGLSASLKAGIASLPKDADGAFLFLGDMPRVPAEMADRLAERLSGLVLACAPLCGTVRGHPVLVARALFPALAALEGDRGARAVLDALGDRLALVETGDEGVLYDVDAPGDLQE